MKCFSFIHEFFITLLVMWSCHCHWAVPLIRLTRKTSLGETTLTNHNLMFCFVFVCFFPEKHMESLLVTNKKIYILLGIYFNSCLIAHVTFFPYALISLNNNNNKKGDWQLKLVWLAILSANGKTTAHSHDIYPTELLIAPDHLQHYQPNTAPLSTIRSLCSDNNCVELEFQ